MHVYWQAQVLCWRCFSKVHHICDKQLWEIMQQTMNAIIAGIKVNCLAIIANAAYYSESQQL